MISKNSNRLIKPLACNYTGERDMKPTTLNKIRAVIGLLYIAGKYKANHLNLNDLWGKNEKVISIYIFLRLILFILYLCILQYMFILENV